MIDEIVEVSVIVLGLGVASWSLPFAASWLFHTFRSMADLGS